MLTCEAFNHVLPLTCWTCWTPRWELKISMQYQTMKKPNTETITFWRNLAVYMPSVLIFPCWQNRCPFYQFPRSPGGTPVCGWPKRHREPDMLPYFNTKLIEKFQNVKSPGRSPLASPGTFDSPTL